MNREEEDESLAKYKATLLAGAKDASTSACVGQANGGETLTRVAMRGWRQKPTTRVMLSWRSSRCLSTAGLPSC